MAGKPLSDGPFAAKEVSARVDARFPANGQPAGRPLFANVDLPLQLQRQNESVSLTVPMDTVCAYDVVVVRSDELNAYADGTHIFVTSAMLRFASEDFELETVLAHEFAHDVMRHADAQQRNAKIGALFGAVVDVALATQGVNKGGQIANQSAAIGARSYSQEFEREADYVGLYILARAGRSHRDVPNFWRRMANESPGSIKFASSHPTTAERYVRLATQSEEIDAKRQAGVPLIPELKPR